jgi:hypothetical protein
MPDLAVDLFVEDRAHEAFLSALTRRLALELALPISVRAVSARGGHPRALQEFGVYQTAIVKGAIRAPDLVVIGRDSNCRRFTETRNEVLGQLDPLLSPKAVTALPDPHVEKWFLADLDCFKRVVGVRPTVRQGKCDRGYYKKALAEAIRASGSLATLGGIEYADELVASMDLYRASKSDASLGHFIDDLRAKLRVHAMG